jgi:hypothetical protein
MLYKSHFMQPSRAPRWLIEIVGRVRSPTSADMVQEALQKQGRGHLIHDFTLLAACYTLGTKAPVSCHCGQALVPQFDRDTCFADECLGKLSRASRCVPLSSIEPKGQSDDRLLDSFSYG